MTARAPQAAAGRSNRFFLCFNLNNPLRMGTHLLEHPGFQGRPKIPLPEPECPCAALVSPYDKASASEPQRRPSRPECKHHRKSGRANRLTRTGSRVRVGALRAAQHGRPSGRLWGPASCRALARSQLRVGAVPTQRPESEAFTAVGSRGACGGQRSTVGSQPVREYILCEP